MTKTDVSVM